MKTSRYVLTLMCALVLGSGVATAASSQPTGVSPWDSQASVQAPWLPQGAVSAGEAEEVHGEGLIGIGLGAAANYVAKKMGWDTRFTLFAPLCAGEDC